MFVFHPPPLQMDRLTDYEFLNDGLDICELDNRTRNGQLTLRLDNGKAYKAIRFGSIACIYMYIYLTCILNHFAFLILMLSFTFLLFHIPETVFPPFPSPYTFMYINASFDKNITLSCIYNTACFTCTYILQLLHLSMYIAVVALSLLPVHIKNIYLVDKIHFSSMYRNNFTLWFRNIGRLKYGRHNYTPQNNTYTYQQYKRIILLLIFLSRAKLWLTLTYDSMSYYLPPLTLHYFIIIIIIIIIS